MSPLLTFFFGLILLGLFAWYLFAEADGRKRWLGTILSILVLGYCFEEAMPPSQKIRLGLDLKGGTSFLIRLVHAQGTDLSPDSQSKAVEVIRKRVDQFGTSEPVITPQGTDRILVQIPGLDTAKIAEAREQLQKVAHLEFRMVHPESDRIIAGVEQGTGIKPPGFDIKEYKEDRNGKSISQKIVIRDTAALDGTSVKSAHAYYDQRGYGVALNFDAKGGEIFGQLTKEFVGQRFAILLDGEVQSAPVIREPILSGSATITGSFSDQEARNLASVLENPLATPVQIEEVRSASATLGADSIKSGVFAGLGGLALVLIFVLIYYRIPGVIAVIGLAINIVFLFGAMSMFNFVLTLPGIAGVILLVGMAVDANVLIYERLREELATGKSLAASAESAYDKAFSVILDANATTLITSAILFWKASGPVKGFAVTLTVGIVGSVFCAMVVTRACFAWLLKGGLTKIHMMQMIPQGTTWDFLGKRRLWIGISVTVIALSIAIVAIRGEKNLGIDFKGGDLLMLASEKQVTDHEVRESLKSIGMGEAMIQREKAGDSEFISIRSPLGTSEKIEAHLKQTLPAAGFSQHKQDRVGTLVGGELATTSIIALGLGMLGILLYVTIRFEFSFAIGAIVALVHDVVITLGMFALTGKEFSLIMVGAILTIAGYSINDTIVVYDRIREGLKAGRKGSVQSIMNASINETLSRTLLTSGMTLLCVLALFLYGGPVLRDFAFAILIGIVVGTYSSIFIASPVVLWWSQRKGRTLHQEIRATEQQAA